MKILPNFISRKFGARPNLLNVIDNIGWLFVERILRLGVGLFVGVWFARYLGPEQFGLFSYVSAFVALFGAFASLGLNNIIVRDLVTTPETTNLTLGTAFVLRSIGGIVAVGLMVLIIGWLRPEDEMSRTLVAILGFTLILKASDVIKCWFESQVQSRYVVWVESSVLLVMAVTKIFLILQHAPLLVFIWLVVVESALVGAGLIGIYLQQKNTLGNWSAQLYRARTLLRDSWPLALSGIAIILYMRIDQIMLGDMLNDEAVGIYSAAMKISELWYMIPVTIVASLFPTIIKSKLTNEALYRERLQSLMNVLVSLALVISIVIGFTANWITLLLYEQKYSGAGLILSIHVWACVFVFLGIPGSRWYLAENLQHIQLRRILGGAIINISLNFILIPAYGGVGAAISTVFSQAFAAYFLDAISKRTRVLFLLKTRAIFLGPINLILKR